MVQMNFDTASAHCAINPGTLDVIRACNSLVRVNFPLRRDSGEIEVIRGYRAQHKVRARRGPRARAARVCAARGHP